MKIFGKAELLSEKVRYLDLEKIRSIRDLLLAFQYTSIQSRNLGKALSIYERMLSDPARPTIFMGLAGPMVPGGMRKVIRDMIEYGLIDVLVSTGANLYQDFYIAQGFSHYIGSPNMDDLLLRKYFIDRIYDTLVDEEKFRETDDAIAKIAEGLQKREYSSREFLEILGRHINDKNSILYTAAQKGVPIFCPALNDSSIGIGLTKHYSKNNERIVINPIRDNYELAQIKMKSKTAGVIYIGGGTPKNYIQQMEVISEVLGAEENGYRYAIQITTDTPQWGGLSGCTFEEAQSWGKIHKEADKIQITVESTIGMPLLVGAVLQGSSYKKRKPLQLKWEGDKLSEMKKGK